MSNWEAANPNHCPVTLGMLPLGRVISKHQISFHCYADDRELNIKTTPDPLIALSSLTTGLEETKAWMNSNFLQLNCNKTEVLHIGTPHQARSSPITHLTFNGQIIPLSIT